MQKRLVYVELKSGHGHTGPAWIGFAKPSKSGLTLYFNGLALKSLKGSGISCNYFDVLTGDEYWISGVKKNAMDRHWAGGGDVLIDEAAVTEYLEATKRSALPKHIRITQLEPSIQRAEHRNYEDGKDVVKLPDRYPY
ncbi:MAG: hypothetical protein AAF583_17685 [Pseudomonadota bacterium]